MTTPRNPHPLGVPAAAGMRPAISRGPRMPAPISRYTRSQRSQAMTEFALIGPILLLIILLIVDFGRGIYYFVTIDNAANEGARVAAGRAARTPSEPNR